MRACRSVLKVGAVALFSLLVGCSANLGPFNTNAKPTVSGSDKVSANACKLDWSWHFDDYVKDKSKLADLEQQAIDKALAHYKPDATKLANMTIVVDHVPVLWWMAVPAGTTCILVEGTPAN
ncbi:hypothetical protein [Helicobacter cetorum]|uniref:hypothetical protein n=1 Tax=Helicobacter cetorum TaxID=138563 RepID=UPI0013157C64|nr:hypothetical protein [Helicobacter cetorum]